MSTQQVQCDVTVPKNRKFGQFANAFRILPDTGHEYLLDFLVFSKQEKEAVVIARVRVNGHLLGMIRDTLSHVLTELGNTKNPPEQPLVILAKGSEEVH